MSKKYFTTKEENDRVRLDFLESFLKKIKQYLDNTCSIYPGSEAHNEINVVCGE